MRRGRRLRPFRRASPRARYILRDQATGEWSDITTDTFAPWPRPRR